MINVPIVVLLLMVTAGLMIIIKLHDEHHEQIHKPRSKAPPAPKSLAHLKDELDTSFGSLQRYARTDLYDSKLSPVGNTHSIASKSVSMPHSDFISLSQDAYTAAIQDYTNVRGRMTPEERYGLAMTLLRAQNDHYFHKDVSSYLDTDDVRTYNDPDGA